MEINALSATGIKDFLQCQQKFLFRYNKEISGVRGNDAAKLGTAVHKALEQFTLRMQAKKRLPEQSDYDFATIAFLNSAVQEGLEDLSLYPKGKQIVIDYINKSNPLEKIIAVEYYFTITTPEGVPLVGAMDKVVEIDSDTLGIHDYKTGKNVLTRDQLSSDIQLSLYDLAASMLWPQYPKRVLCLDYVGIGKSLPARRTDEERLAFREFLVSVWNEVNSLSEKEVKGKLNSLCGWCSYKAHCAAYTSYINSSSLEFTDLTGMSDAEFLAHWEEIGAKKTILDSRQRELKMVASERFMRGEQIEASGRELYSTQNSRTNYAIEELADLLPREVLLEVLNVSTTKLEKCLRDYPDLKSKVSQLANVSYDAPRYGVRNSPKSAQPKTEIVDDETYPNEDVA